MATTVNQASANPTNKLSAATVAAALMGLLGLALRNLAPQWYDQEVLVGLLPVVVYAAGWFIKDAPNITVVTTDTSA
jgi:hypothetical protein